MPRGRPPKHKPKAPPLIVTGGLDELRSASNYCRRTGKEILFTLSSPDDLRVAENILKDANIKVTSNVTLLLVPQKIENEPEPSDEFFNSPDELPGEVEWQSNYSMTAKLAKSQARVAALERELEGLRTPKSKPDLKTLEGRRAYMREYMRRRYVAKKKASEFRHPNEK